MCKYNQSILWSLIIVPPFSLRIRTCPYHYDLQIAGETFEIIQSDVLQGSKVILDVEEEGLDERTILSLDAATKISSSGSTCFRSLALDGKEYCFVDAQPGQCSSFTGPEGHRQLIYIPANLFKMLITVVTTAAPIAAPYIVPGNPPSPASSSNSGFTSARYTLRMGETLHESPSGEVSWQLSESYTGPHTDKFLSDYTSEPYLYNSETLAKDACIARAECNGVTQEGSSNSGSTLAAIKLKEAMKARAEAAAAYHAAEEAAAAAADAADFEADKALAAEFWRRMRMDGKAVMVISVAKMRMLGRRELV